MTLKKRGLIIGIIILLVIAGAFIWNYSKNKDSYSFKGDTLYYSEKRGAAEYEILSKSSNNSIDIYRILFKSKNFLENPTTIYGLLFVPKEKKDVPGLVFLPAGAATKEGRISLLSNISKEGYAVLAIDQRGIGETGGAYLSLEQDYQVVQQGKEPIQHLSVYDALKTYDVLREFKEADIDKENIGFSGESMGARYAIMAAAIEKRSRGAIAISAAGFHIEPNALQQGNNFLISIDPDHYIASISPNYVIMLHSTNDTLILLKDAQATFSRAKEPKKLSIVGGCTHGYCDKMWGELKAGLKLVFGR